MARSEAPEDPRAYVRVSIDLPMNPKLNSIDDPAAGWAYVVSLCYCAQSFTDGHFPMRAVLGLAGVGKEIGMALVEQGLWHLPGHDCDRCEQPKVGQVVVHDYLRHQRSAAEVQELTSKRRAAGRKGAKSRWTKSGSDGPASGSSGEADQPLSDPQPPEMASAMASAKQVPRQMHGKPMADERRGEEIRTPPPEGDAEPASTDDEPPPPDDALFDAGDKPNPPRQRTPPTDTNTVTAKDIIAAFVDASREAGLDDPTSGVVGRVGRDAKRLLEKEKVNPEKLLRAAKMCGANGWTSIEVQLRRLDAERVQQGRRNGQLGASPPRRPGFVRDTHVNVEDYLVDF